MHKFPKDANLRRQWVEFVQVKRANFVEPTEHSVICNIHFSPDCYKKRFMVEIGLRKQSPLLSGAVPTIQSPGATKSAGKVLKGASDLQCLQHKMAAQLGHVLPR